MTENIFLFIPNIVDYLRVITAFISFYYLPTDPWSASFWYLLSGLLDAIDGHLARMLDQGSKLGAMLDMLIDRCATMCLMAALCHFYPKYMLFFQFSMALDITSHWFHVQSSLMKGGESHKKLDLSANPILKHYYHNRIILFVMCSANELFFCMLYLTYFTPGPTLLGIGLFQAILYISAPLSFIKAGISVLQLIAASKNIALIDQSDREARKTK
ncbi:CDP-diacylglycerol--inositol 3-phosphatidyltransferase-like [Saccostrea cucullata]|uniref:CDP-diacylglycerol--inositol 3-phosphatidyltransferase-like n=1 Tax=Saccostrea cuccullata TaxID=36930 RepID=UPI002ED00803